MQIKQENLTPTSVKLTITASKQEIDAGKELALNHLGRNAKLPGFRAGKAPSNLIEKNLDPAELQNEFLNETVNVLYIQAVSRQSLKVADQPEITITKFVPFTELEFSATIAVIGTITLPDYKKIKVAKDKAVVEAKDVNEVIDNLRERSATKDEVKRAAKLGDEVNLDFKGTDAKTKATIDGADGKDYDLILGSESFIPGFEEEVVGLKAGAKKSFDITFPGDYGAASLQNRKVTFDIVVNEVKELVKPKADDEFATTVGPFKTLAELKSDIKKQITVEKQREVDQKFDNDLLQKLADKTEVSIPEAMIDQEADRMEEEEKSNLVYRGQTWQEHLSAEGIDEKEHHNRQKPAAETRIKIGLLLGEIAEEQNIKVSDADLETRIALLKSQYSDPKMQSELDKPEGRRDIKGRMLVEQTLDYLRKVATV